MPSSGKTYILDRIDFIEVFAGSKLLHCIDSDFDLRDKVGREQTRKAMADSLLAKNDFIMDGHYAFGDELAFTEEDGKLYDTFLYLYSNPDLLASRMNASPKNRRYLKYDLASWQQKEISGLREYCHTHNKDFYILDNPPSNDYSDPNMILDFIKDIVKGYSCVAYAQRCVQSILSTCKESTVFLLDGDKTLTIEDSSNAVFGYKTHLFDGNFYTGYQRWKQEREFKEYKIPDIQTLPVHLNERVLSSITGPAYILTSGHERIWEFISKSLNMPCFCGADMSAETKLYITKTLQDNNLSVIAYGDSMNDYYMLKQADRGFLVKKPNGSISRSLKEKNLEGLTII